MLGEGMKDEAYKTAWGHLSHRLRNQGLLVSARPEAWGHHRLTTAPPCNMRPAAIWAMEMTEPRIDFVNFFTLTFCRI